MTADITLPEPLITHLEAVRRSYIEHFANVGAQIASEDRGNVIIEAALAGEGEDFDYRFDLLVEEKDGIAREFVVSPSSCPWPHAEYTLGTTKLMVDEIVWFSCAVIVQPALPDVEAVRAWFKRWLVDGADVEEPFGGYPHFLDIEQFEDGMRIDVDLGSAPVDALEELIALCVAQGSNIVWLFSAADALAARLPEGDDEDGDGEMLELPDDLLDHLGAVREDYLDTFVDRLREIGSGRVAIEAPAGRAQGTLELRVDIAQVADDNSFTQVEVTAGKALPWEDAHYAMAGLDLYVMKMVWPAVLVMAWPAPADTAFLGDWFRKWIEQGFEMAKPFGGYVHLMSPPKLSDDKLSVLVDLGTAPVEALRELVEKLKAAGATSVTIGSGELALSGSPVL